jgi:hypothetical protein
MAPGRVTTGLLIRACMVIISALIVAPSRQWRGTWETGGGGEM